MKRSEFQIRVREMKFPFLQNYQIPKYWFDGDPWLTNFFNVLSGVIPEGERLFVFSVDNVRHQITDPNLIEDIKRFTGQETRHLRDHKKINDLIDQQHGIPIKWIEREVKSGLAKFRREYSHLKLLAITAALEHLLAISSEAHLKMEPELLTKERVYLADLFIWHSLEEIEHKAVAFDVYQAVGGGYGLRVLAMLIASFTIIFGMFFYHVKVLRVQGELFNLRSCLRFCKYQIGWKGFVWRVLPHYFAYYLPNFHPWNHDNYSQVSKYVEQFTENEI